MLFSPHNDKKLPVLLASALCLTLFFTAFLLFATSISTSALLFIVIVLTILSAGLIMSLVKFLNELSLLELQLEEASRGKDLLTGLPDQLEFIARLDVECRRSIREFTPLSIMYVGFANELNEQSAINVAENLIRAVYRPGDMVARIDETTFGLVLPSTNELVKQLAERCLSDLSALGVGQPVSIGLCTYQPTIDLTPNSAMEKVHRLLNEAIDEGGSMINSEAEENIAPSVTYQY